MLVGNLPPDANKDDVKVLNTLATEVYRKIEDPIDKLIVALTFELGYPREETARALGVSYVTVYKRIINLKTKLKNKSKYLVED